MRGSVSSGADRGPKPAIYLRRSRIAVLPTVSEEIESLASLVWFIAWLFTIGLARLGLAKGTLALFIWPYYLGRALVLPPR
jgi:hypothetical protein